MAFKYLLLCAALASAQAGYLEPTLSYAGPSFAYGAPAALTSQSSNILRSEGNLAQLSTFSKSIDTPFSSVNKADVRLSRPAVYSALSYGAPSYSIAQPSAVISKAALAAPGFHYAAPGQFSYASSAPAFYAKPALSSAPLSYAAAAPALYAKPALSAAPLTYASAAPAFYAKPALSATPWSYSEPLYAKHALSYEAPLIKDSLEYGAPGPLLSHTTFTGLGTAYAY